MRLCALSVDLDEVHHYYAIHGLTSGAGGVSVGADGADGAHAVYDVAIPRLLDFASAARVPLTLFAVGADLARPGAAAALRGARGAGCEIANHSRDHLYDLTRKSRDVLVEQVAGGADAIERAVGERPRGFRAPGYTITDALFEVLAELGVAYDSSVFPCPAYFAAKAAAIALIRARGRASHSVVDAPRVLAAPTDPYRVGTPYWTRGGGLVEMPIQVTRGLRLPFIGTSVTLGGPVAARALAAMCVGAPVINLELHGIDVLDAADGLASLAPHQPDVRVPTARKLESLHACVTTLRAAGYAFVTLEEAASTVRA